MPIKSFKFISPGIFINEIDNSQLPAVGAEMGPVIIGRTARGPAMRPVKVNSFSEFVEVFGNPSPGNTGVDVWRDGSQGAPTYASYAAQAYLRNSNALTVVRLLGAQHADATDAGKAGWKTTLDNTVHPSTNGGAYGLFVFNSGTAVTQVDGALAATWYLTEGTIELSGTQRGLTVGINEGSLPMTGAAGLFVDNAGEYKAIIKDDGGITVKETSFNFTPSSAKYIRKVFNTDATLTDGTTTSGENQEIYFLGATYERHLADTVTSLNNSVATIMGLDKDATSASDFKQGFQAAQTPWIIAQNKGATALYDAQIMKKLFKFHTLDAGEEEMKKLKISITDIKVPRSDGEWATFSVQIRSSNDSDSSPIVIEQYSSVNLNENSSKYLGRVVGDQYLEWSDVTNSHTVKGDFLNASKLVRVEMGSNIVSDDMPFGSFGPVRMSGWTSDGTAPAYVAARWVAGSGSIPHAVGTRIPANGSEWLGTGSATTRFTGSAIYPSIPLRHSASDGGIPDQKNAYFGIDTSQAGNNNYNEGYGDLLKILPGHSFSASGTDTEYSYMFSLDDVVAGTITGSAFWESGSCMAGESLTSDSSAGVLDAGYNRFTVPLYGGYDGIDITVRSPFATPSLVDGQYGYHSVQRAINTVSDPEVVEYNLMAAPGVMNEALTSHMVNVCEARGDALAIIDLKSGYQTAQEITSPSNGSVALALSNMKARAMNSSYGCAYYPWVQISDTVNDAILWAPPSIVALGTFSSSQRKSELWFAPAGFTRGGLTEGSAGVPVIQTRERLTSRNRDDLYEANINPIASFPSEGIVIFGQKTLQVTPSALDRINVRRLMIFVKKEISRMAATVLFDQNVPATWNRFMSRAEPFLRSVQARLGLSDFKIVLDETTTTADLVDRNVMYAKIFLKPARSIEFIALDFVISSTGAGFED